VVLVCWLEKISFMVSVDYLVLPPPPSFLPLGYLRYLSSLLLLLYHSPIHQQRSIMKLVRHNYVVDLKEVLASRTKIFIVLELITGGELFDKIVSEGRFDEHTARFYFRQLVDGVEYCHSRGVCHRDLKPENLLLDEKMNLKISDFGLSALYDAPPVEGGTDAATGGGGSSQLLHTTCGTPNYVAPEVLADKGYDGRAADVWSIGVILYVLLAGFLPFDEPTMSALFRKIQKAEFTYPTWFSPEVRALLDKVLVAQPEKRITLIEVKQDLWYNKDIDEAQIAAEKARAAMHGPPKPAEHTEKEHVSSGFADADVKDDESRDDAPKSLNAFDLISMCGHVALNRMFSTESERKVQRYTQFLSTLSGPLILAKVRELLSKDPRVKIDSFEETTLKIRSTVETNKGEIGIIAQVFVLCPDLHLVEVRRGRGDIFEYHAYHTLLMEQMKAAFPRDINATTPASK
jgi:serine/threonine protein kinase